MDILKMALGVGAFVLHLGILLVAISVAWMKISNRLGLIEQRMGQLDASVKNGITTKQEKQAETQTQQGKDIATLQTEHKGHEAWIKELSDKVKAM